MAYGSLLQERRRALHARIVEALEALAGDRVAEQVERLAHHALRGEVWDKALAYCRQAGEKAMARSAYREAVGYFEQALSALPHLPETRDTREQAIDLRLALRSALRPSGDSGRILASLREAEALAEALDDPRRLGQVSVLLSRHFDFMGAYDQAIASAQRALALATAGGEVVLQALANQRLGTTYHAQGDYRRAIDSLRQTVAALEGARRHERFGRVFLPAVASRAFLAWCHAELGRFRRGPCLRGRRAADCRGGGSPREPDGCLVGDRAAVPPPRRPAQGAPPARTGRGHLSGGGPPVLFPLDGCGLGGGVYPGRARRRRRAAAHAGDGTSSGIRGRTAIRRSVSLSLGEAQLLAGRLEEAQALAEQALALPVSTRNGAIRPMPCGSSARLRRGTSLRSATGRSYYRQALALAEELGMRPLRPTATSAWARCMPRPAGESRPAPNCPPLSSCTAPWR